MSNMPAHWLRLAGQLLEMASEKFSNAGCNDLNWPDGWTPEMRRELVVAMVEANTHRTADKFTAGDREEVEHHVRSDQAPGDWWLMWFFADRLTGDE